MKSTHPIFASTFAALGSVSLLLATPQMDPEGVTEVSEFIQMEIYHDNMMKGSEITVSIENGIATLSGVTGSLSQAERASAKAFTSPEVLAVVNRIVISPRDEGSILSEARELLASHELIDAEGVSVSAKGSRVILEGEVGSLDEVELAREIVSEASGVTAVETNLTVNFQSIRSDALIAAQLEYTMNDDPLFTGLDIAPVVKDGVVAWKGEVGSRGEFDRLIRRSYVTGVIKVDASRVSVNGDLAMEAVEDKDYSPSQSLEALTTAIGQDPRLKSENISAVMKEGVVVLNGTVETSAKRDAAELTARCIPGVLSVSNRLALGGVREIATNIADLKAASPKLVKPPIR